MKASAIALRLIGLICSGSNRGWKKLGRRQGLCEICVSRGKIEYLEGGKFWHFMENLPFFTKMLQEIFEKLRLPSQEMDISSSTGNDFLISKTCICLFDNNLGNNINVTFI